jgi:hypothetical protein
MCQSQRNYEFATHTMLGADFKFDPAPNDIPRMPLDSFSTANSMLTTGQRNARQQPACFPLVVIDLYPQVFHRHDYPLVRPHLLSHR